MPGLATPDKELGKESRAHLLLYSFGGEMEGPLFPALLLNFLEAGSCLKTGAWPRWTFHLRDQDSSSFLLLASEFTCARTFTCVRALK